MPAKFKIGDKVRQISEKISMRVTQVIFTPDKNYSYVCVWVKNNNPDAGLFLESKIELSPPFRGGTKKIASLG